MNKKLLTIGRFLRIVDETQDCLSITNVALLTILVKVASNPSPSIAEMGGLLVTVCLYYSKKHLARDKVKLTDENKAALTEMQTKIQNIADKASGLAMHVGLRSPIK